jgi:hypothetical protein
MEVPAPHVNRLRLIILASILVIVAVGVAIVVVARRDPGGMPTPEEAVAEYIESLRLRDRGRLERLADPEYIAGPEIDRRLAELGGGRLVIDDARINPTESEILKAAYLTGRLDNQPYTDKLWLDRHDGRWFIELGEYKGPPGNREPR